MICLVFRSLLESLAWAAVLFIGMALFSGCSAPQEQDPLSSVLAGAFLVAAWTGVGGWYLRGWYDRRMRPTVSDEPNEEVTRIGQQWAASLAHLNRGDA